MHAGRKKSGGLLPPPVAMVQVNVGGVVRALPTLRMPEESPTTTSVKVPPVSMPIRYPLRDSRVRGLAVVTTCSETVLLKMIIIRFFDHKDTIACRDRICPV